MPPGGISVDYLMFTKYTKWPNIVLFMFQGVYANYTFRNLPVNVVLR